MSEEPGLPIAGDTNMDPFNEDKVSSKYDLSCRMWSWLHVLEAFVSPLSDQENSLLVTSEVTVAVWIENKCGKLATGLQTNLETSFVCCDPPIASTLSTAILSLCAADGVYLLAVNFHLIHPVFQMFGDLFRSMPRLFHGHLYTCTCMKTSGIRHLSLDYPDWIPYVFLFRPKDDSWTPSQRVF